MKTIQLSRRQVHQGPLVLVNRQNPIMQPDGLIVQPDGRALAAVHRACPDILLERKAARLLSACLAEIHGTGRIVPVSGWRSRAEQQQIWEDSLRENGEAFTRQYVARPGCSEHETGLAIDLGKASANIDFIRPDFPYSGLCQVFRQAALRYGFVERYPCGKQHITGISHEPWHFRYVGAPHAQLMWENGLCLEEYMDFLKQRERSVSLGNGGATRIFYVPCTGERTACALPRSRCQISGNNTDGFIVTVWEASA